MPQLILYKRRWRVASDSLPLLSGLLAFFHLAFLIPLIIVTSNTESQNYTCNQKFQVKFALFGTLFLYLFSAINELVVTYIGLKGGPLEEHRRRFMHPLLHMEVILWLLILVMTCYATYVSATPTIAATCWSNNPCEYSEAVIPSMCTKNRTGDVTLTDACLTLWNDGDGVSTCIESWMAYGATAYISYYSYSEPNPLFPGPYNNETELNAYFKPVDPATYVCNDTYASTSKQFDNFLIDIYGPSLATYIEQDRSSEYEWQLQQDNLTLQYEWAVLDGLNITYNKNTAGSDAPWFKCFDSRCQRIVAAGDECTDWKTMMNIPSSKNRKAAYLATIYASWGMLFVQVLIVYIAFNAWPNYEEEETWEASVKRWSQLLCCGHVLEKAETEEGQQATKEIGSLLHILFGAIDLDPSDQFLGMFLVSERQRWRRHRYALSKLKAAGIVPRERPKTFFGRMWSSCKAFFNKSFDWYHSRKDVTLANTLEGSQSVTEGNMNQIIDEALGEQHSKMEKYDGQEPQDATASVSEAQNNLTPPQLVVMPPSPFDLPASPFASASSISPISPAASASVPSADATTTATTPATAASSATIDSTRSIAFMPPGIAHSFVRLISLRPSLSFIKSPQLDAVDEDEEDAAAPSPLVPPPTSKSNWRNWFRSKNKAALSSGDQNSRSSSAVTIPPQQQVLPERTSPHHRKLQGVPEISPAKRSKLVVESKDQPLVTPVTMHSLVDRLPVSSYEAARIYGIGSPESVSHEELEVALALSGFAKAAYGLQTVRWAYASQSQGCSASTYDSCLASACCAPLRGPLHFDAHFRKRNFDAILALTGIEAADFLYVSYTSAAFGVLPYMILLHRPTQSVVVSVRGTVGFDDLITDLLSNPVDASASLPKWVKEHLDPNAPQYVHAGILSSTNAVLRDLEENGLLDAMMKRAGSSTAYSNGNGNAETDEDAEELAAEASAVLEGTPSERRKHVKRMLTRIRTMHSERDEISLSLRRAQTIVGEAVGNRGWRVVVTGHSLGAAVATLMSFHLREHFPTLKCMVFCPPGGLMSKPLAHLAKRFCTSVVVGCDAISRLSFPNTQRVVDDMVLALARCKRPKLAILVDVLLGRRNDPDTTPPTFCAFEDVGGEAQQALKKYVATSKLHASSADTQLLFPPGRIIHLRPFAGGKKKKHDVWDAVWAAAEDIMGEGVLLTFDMMRHHRMPTLQEALKSALRGEAKATITAHKNLDTTSQQQPQSSRNGAEESV